MISVIYISFFALLIVRLSWNVVRLRRQKRIALGDGGDKELQKAIGAMENASEYIPITMLLLAAVEINGAPLWLVHVLGVIFMIGRFMHAYGVVNRFKWRVQGMWITVFIMSALVVANLFYLPYDKII
ncbi:MAG: MAPEG family protein [Gammaproteobacteria bacterium]|jgi:uncharacterized membrane protein YecN with MAPEG domain